jgi:hypothetical protein
LTAVVITSVVPPILHRTSPIHDTDIQKACGIKFYFKGGVDLLAVQRSSTKVFTVYIPLFSDLTVSTSTSLIASSENEISKQMEKRGIKSNDWFIFDTNSKQILSYGSFMDFIPYSSIKKAVFIIENKDGTNNGELYYLSDNSDYSLVQFLSTVVAKRELMYSKAASWSKSGKQLLSFLVSKRFHRPVDFSKAYGCWDPLNLIFNSDRLYPMHIDLSKLNVGRASALAARMYYEDSDPPEFGIEPGTGDVTLSDLLMLGVRSFCNSGYGRIEIIIDFMADVYKQIIIDGTSGICFVSLNSGVDVTLDRIKEDLQADDVQLMSSETNITTIRTPRDGD